MFCSLFCNTNKEEVAKTSVFFFYESETEIEAESVSTVSSSLFQHLDHLNQPASSYGDEEVSLSVSELFDPPLDDQHVYRPLLAAAIRAKKQLEAKQMPMAVEENEALPMVSAKPPVNEFPHVSMQEFVATMDKIEKENKWVEKRQTKKEKANGKKKSRRNNKTKQGKALPNTAGSLQQRKQMRSKAQGQPASLAPRMPLQSRN